MGPTTWGAMHVIPLLVDLSIRRACGFAFLAIGTVMLSLSFDLPLALRSGADMTGLVCCALVFLAWRSRRCDVRHTEFWSMFAARNPEVLAQGDRARLQEAARRIWRQRLIWHAERIGVVAVVLWAGAAAGAMVRAAIGG